VTGRLPASPSLSTPQILQGLRKKQDGERTAVQGLGRSSCLVGSAFQTSVDVLWHGCCHIDTVQHHSHSLYPSLPASLSKPWLSSFPGHLKMAQFCGLCQCISQPIGAAWWEQRLSSGSRIHLNCERQHILKDLMQEFLGLI
jgi:hypothetical protein